MALGDGTTWDETLPDDNVVAIQIDDYNRDLRVGIRKRMAREHEWAASQAATSEGGAHKFITLQEQAVKPTLAGTQKAAVYANTNNNLLFEKSDGTEVLIVSGTALNVPTFTLSNNLLINTGMIATTAGMSGGGYSTELGQYFYLCQGYDTNGKFQVVSGYTNQGVAIPLPTASCSQADCHWIVTPKYFKSPSFAFYGIDVVIASNRVVTFKLQGINWVG